MSELGFSEDPDRLVITSPMPWGRRLLFALIGVFPLLAPWELLLQTRWSSYPQPLFLLSLVISLGAIALSGLLFFAAFAGLSSRLDFDGARSTFACSAVAPLVPRRVRTYSLASVERVDVRIHEWTDGAPSYSVRIVTTGEVSHESGSSWSRDEVEGYVARVSAFLTQHRCAG